MKVNRISKSVTGLAAILLVTLAFSGCASKAIPVNLGSYTSGRILILPPRDVVQKGIPHQKGVRSGRIFQNYLKSSFLGTPFEVVTTDSKEFGPTQIAEKEIGLVEAKNLNADYCLQVVLGEFQNAAPMTFRPDYVILDSAIMYDVRTGDIAWELIAPVTLKKGNPGNHLVLLEKHAQAIAKSIQQNMK
jgi:hypothetical protein